MWALGIILLELITSSRISSALEYATVTAALKPLPAQCPDQLFFKLTEMSLRAQRDRAIATRVHAMLGEDFAFLEGAKGENCYSMVVLTDDDAPPISFDLVYVISAPLDDLQWLSRVTDKASHSVVIAVNSSTKTGFMMEYTSAHKVYCTAGRLVRRTEESLTRKPFTA